MTFSMLDDYIYETLRNIKMIRKVKITFIEYLQCARYSSNSLHVFILFNSHSNSGEIGTITILFFR